MGALLGAMLAVLAGHVMLASREWGDSFFGLGENTLSVSSFPDPAGEQPDAGQAERVNQQLYAALAGTDAVVVFDGAGGDGPRLGIFDPGGYFSDMSVVSGRPFKAGDFDRSTTGAVVSATSYVVGREQLYIPDGVDVIGYYDPDSSPFATEYLYSLFVQGSIDGTYYVKSADASVARSVAAALSDGGTRIVSIREIDTTVWGALQGDSLTYAYSAALLLACGSIALLVGNWTVQNQSRIEVHLMFGATPLSFALRILPMITGVAAVGAGIGLASGFALVSGLDTLDTAPDPVLFLALLGIETLVVSAIFVSVIALHGRAKVIR